MASQCVWRVSWISFLLFSVAVCVPVKRGQTGTSYGFGAGSGYHSGGLSSGSGSTGGGAGSGFDAGLLAAQDRGISQIIAELMLMNPNRPFPRFPWTFEQVPLGMVEDRPVYPSSHLVHTSSGYQRARNLRSDAKYTQDTFDHIPLSGNDQGSDSMSESRGQKRTQ